MSDIHGAGGPDKNPSPAGRGLDGGEGYSWDAYSLPWHIRYEGPFGWKGSQVLRLGPPGLTVQRRDPDRPGSGFGPRDTVLQIPVSRRFARLLRKAVTGMPPDDVDVLVTCIRSIVATGLEDVESECRISPGVGGTDVAVGAEIRALVQSWTA